MGPYYVILIPAIGGLIIGPIIYFFSQETKGHGVPEVMLAVSALGGKIRPRVAAIKALTSSICIGSGGSVGREGPIVQIGSALGSSIGQLFNLSEEKIKILVASGAAGGIAATFNAPLAGIFFALEVILGEYGPRFLSSVVLSSVTATVISRHFLGDQPAFMIPTYQLLSIWEIPLYFIFGFAAAGAAFLFMKILYKCEDMFNSWEVPEYTKPAVGGLLIGLIGLFFPQIFGVGYETMEMALYGKLAASTVIILVIIKTIATSVTLGSGGSGGVFAPSLFIGAMLGGAYGKLTYLLSPNIAIPSGACALVGMGAVFAGAAQAPISAIIILFEMTGDYKIILPLMITCIISTVMVRQLTRESIYTLKLKRRGVDIQVDRLIRELPIDILVGAVMTVHYEWVSSRLSLTNLDQRFQETRHHGFPVIDEKGDFVGIVTLTDLEKTKDRAGDGKGITGLTVADIMTREVLTCSPDDTLPAALRKLGQLDIGRLPVIDPFNPKKLIGMLRRTDIIRTYSKLALKEVSQAPETLAAVEENPKAQFMEVTVAAKSSLAGRCLEEISLPQDCLFVCIRRKGRTIIPHGTTIFEPNDRIIAIATGEAIKTIHELCQK
jgi:CIC family chloride channel protein